MLKRRRAFCYNPRIKPAIPFLAVALASALSFDAGPLGEKAENKAIGLFSHGGVANHPGDLGMKRLADLILKGFK